MTKPRFSILIADPQSFPRLGVGAFEYELEKFGEAGIAVALGTCASEDDIIRQGQKKDAILILTHIPFGERACQNLPDCKVVLRYGVGVDSIDLNAATRYGKLVLNAPHSTEDLATHAASLILGLCRQTVFLDRRLRKGEWDALAGYPLRRLSNLTLGIFGLGRAGKWLARIFYRGWGMQVIAVDPFISEEEAQQLNVSLVTFKELLESSDIISIHAPISKETYHAFGEEQFRKMKRTAMIVNTGRGTIIDEKALVKALTEGWVLAAGLDVFEQEPLPKNSPLLHLENVVVTSHAAYYSEDSLVELHKIAVETVIQALNGQVPFNAVNKVTL